MATEMHRCDCAVSWQAHVYIWQSWPPSTSRRAPLSTSTVNQQDLGVNCAFKYQWLRWNFYILLSKVMYFWRYIFRTNTNCCLSLEPRQGQSCQWFLKGKDNLAVKIWSLDHAQEIYFAWFSIFILLKTILLCSVWSPWPDNEETLTTLVPEREAGNDAFLDS